MHFTSLLLQNYPILELPDHSRPLVWRLLTHVSVFRDISNGVIEFKILLNFVQQVNAIAYEATTVLVLLRFGATGLLVHKWGLLNIGKLILDKKYNKH
jgi:hypothetical protein